MYKRQGIDCVFWGLAGGCLAVLLRDGRVGDPGDLGLFEPEEPGLLLLGSAEPGLAVTGGVGGGVGLKTTPFASAQHFANSLT